MKKILLGLGAVSALAIAAPAAAQYQNRNFNYQSQAYAGANFEARLERLEARLRTAVDRGTISRDEGWNLRRQLDALDDLHDRYARDGLSQWEQQDLQQRLRTFRRDMRLAGGNGWGREDRWDDDDDDRYGSGNGNGYDRRDWVDRNNDGYDDRDYDRDGRWEDDVNERVDRNGDGYDDRDYDRDGRWDDDMNSRVDRDGDGWDDRDYNRNGRWDDDTAQGQSPRQDRGIIGTLIDTFVGGGAQLRVGDRAPDSLGGVPYAYRNQYRDGNGVYYRSDGRAIYEIDARYRTVVRIYPIAR